MARIRLTMIFSRNLIGTPYSSQHDVGHVLWRLDRPVSNSGRLRKLISEYAAGCGLDWDARLDDDPDRVLGTEHELVVSADAVVLDRAHCWANLARWIIDQEVATAWCVPMAAT